MKHTTEVQTSQLCEKLFNNTKNIISKISFKTNLFYRNVAAFTVKVCYSVSGVRDQFSEIPAV